MLKNRKGRFNVAFVISDHICRFLIEPTPLYFALSETHALHDLAKSINGFMSPLSAIIIESM